MHLAFFVITVVPLADYDPGPWVFCLIGKVWTHVSWRGRNLLTRVVGKKSSVSPVDSHCQETSQYGHFNDGMCCLGLHLL